MIKITTKNFNLEREFLKISSKNNGGYSFFLGTVRDDLNKSGKKINEIFLECYKDLAVKQLSKIREQAIQKWHLNHCIIIHRIGKISLGEKIVLIITAAPHREDAIRANEFIIDCLKANVAFWKFNISKKKEEIVKFKQKDLKKYLKWSDVLRT